MTRIRQVVNRYSLVYQIAVELLRIAVGEEAIYCYSTFISENVFKPSNMFADCVFRVLLGHI